MIYLKYYLYEFSKINIQVALIKIRMLQIQQITNLKNKS